MSRENRISKELPMGWKKVQIKDVAEKITDGEHFRPRTQESGIPFLSAKDVRDEGVSFDEPLFISEETATKAMLRCNPERGDILIVSRGATVGRMCIVNAKRKFCLLGSVILIKVKKSISSKFINYVLKSPIANQKMITVSGATAQQAIYLRDIKNISIPLQPLKEQQAIVSKIEELLSDLENGKQQLQTAQQQLKVYRQSLLKWAFEGKINNKKVKDGELPKGWKWVKLGEEGKLVSGQHILEKDYNFSKAGIPYFTGPADFGNSFPSVSKWTIHPKVIAKKNDVLITVKGAGVGKINLMHIEEAAISRQLMAFSSSKIDSKYIYNFLSSRFHDFQRLGLGSTVPGIRRDIILNYQMPLCNVKEQQLIVNELESKLTVCDKIEETISQSLKQAEMLRQSILKKAFEGKLVTQNPNDEPASKLLERIKAESPKNEVEKKKFRRDVIIIGGGEE